MMMMMMRAEIVEVDGSAESGERGGERRPVGRRRVLLSFQPRAPDECKHTRNNIHTPQRLLIEQSTSSHARARTQNESEKLRLSLPRARPQSPSSSESLARTRTPV